MVIYVVLEVGDSAPNILSAHKERTAAEREVASYMYNEAASWLSASPEDPVATELLNHCKLWLMDAPQPSLEELQTAWDDSGDTRTIDVHEVTLR